jgi:RNA polymerase sigma-70 factor (ECF subfamily)
LNYSNHGSTFIQELFGMGLKENRIAEKIGKGDIRVFEELFHQYYAGMCSYAESLVNKPEIAEEIVQDVFYNIWKNKSDLKINLSWQSYLYHSVFNNSMMYLRKSKREMSLDEQWIENQSVTDENIGDEMDAKELNTMIIYTLQTLPVRTQEIFNLSRFDGMKYKEIANKLSISVKTVEANMGKALKALRSSLSDFRKIA